MGTNTEKVLREVVKAEQQIPVDFALEKYADDRKSYETSFKTNAGAGDGTTISYTTIPSNNRLAEEGLSKAQWILVFDDCEVDMGREKKFIISEAFLASVIADTGIQVSLPTAQVDEVEMPAQEKNCGVIITTNTSRYKSDAKLIQEDTSSVVTRAIAAGVAVIIVVVVVILFVSYFVRRKNIAARNNKVAAIDAEPSTSN